MRSTMSWIGLMTLVGLGFVSGGVCLLSLVIPAGSVALSAGLALVSGWACKMCFEAAVEVAERL